MAVSTYAAVDAYKWVSDCQPYLYTWHLPIPISCMSEFLADFSTYSVVSSCGIRLPKLATERADLKFRLIARVNPDYTWRGDGLRHRFLLFSIDRRNELAIMLIEWSESTRFTLQGIDKNDGVAGHQTVRKLYNSMAWPC